MSNRDANKRHEKKPIDLSKLSVPEAMEKFMPDRRKIITRLGKGKGDADGNVLNTTQNVRFRRFSIAWGVPMDELGYSYWFMHFVQQSIMPWDDIIICLNTYLPEARSFIHESFVKESKASKYLVMLDSDVIPPMGSIEKLITYKLPLVGGWYPKKSEIESERKPVVYDFVRIAEDGKAMWRIRNKIGEGIEEVDGAGAGFWVMNREVAEAIGPRPYDYLRCGEDLELCLKVREAGYKMYIDWNLKAEHRGVFSV